MEPKSSIRDLPIYQPGKSLEEVKRELGLEQVIKLASNENPFGCSDKVWQAIVEEKDSFHLYPVDHAPALKESLAEHLEIDERRLIFGNGSDEIIQMVARAYLQSGTESVMATPTFPRYETSTRIEGASAVEVPLLEDGSHDLDGMLAAITEKTRVVWICNPNNPTGNMIDEERLVGFIDQVPRNVLIVLDEAYFEYVLDDTYPDSLSLLDYDPRLLILRTFSKIYGIPSLRVGYGIGHPDVIQTLQRVREPFNVNRFAQAAAQAALQDQTFVTYCLNQNRTGKKQILEQIQQWGLTAYPSEANFLLIDTGYPADEVFQFLLQRGVIVRSGTALGFPTCLRVTIGSRAENEQFLAGLSSFLQEQRS